MNSPFTEFALLLLIGALAGAIFVRLRQPVLIAGIVVGIAVGPAGFGLVTVHDQILRSLRRRGRPCGGPPGARHP